MGLECHEGNLRKLRQHIKKQGHYFTNKGPSSQSYDFSSCHVWMWELSCMDDAFELWCWRRLLRVPWTARRSNQSTLEEVSPEYSLKDWCWSWNSNILVTWWEELTHWKIPWCWERLKAGGEWKDRGWDGWMASLTRWTWVWASSGSWWWSGKPGTVHGVEKCWTRLSNWTEPNWKRNCYSAGLQFYLNDKLGT